MSDRDMPELTLLYLKLGVVGILGGLLMTTPLLDMYWLGVVAITVGLLALCLVIKKSFTRMIRRLDEEDQGRG
jgi:hypothetical protein